jgi:hypothetical protein
MLALRLPPEIEARLDALAKKTGRSKSYYAREAILRQIKDIEDYLPGTPAAWTGRLACDARKPGARLQEARKALMAAPAWRVEFDRGRRPSARGLSLRTD